MVTAELHSHRSLLLSGVSSGVRRLIVRERIRAMTGEFERALESLRSALSLVRIDRPRDRIVLGMVQAELLHLNLANDEATFVMRDEVLPHIQLLSHEERVCVEQNHNDLQMLRLEGLDSFYNLSDRKRLLNFDWLDYRELFLAKEDAERGKHYEALPALWRQERLAYMQCCWLAQRLANSHLANEYVQLSNWDSAIHHAILAVDDKVIPRIAEGIIDGRNAASVNTILDRIVATANLRSHFVIGCKLIRELSDGIPNEWIDRIGEWLKDRSRETYGSSLLGTNHVSEAWETVTSLGQRMSPGLADSIVEVAIRHPVWHLKFDDPHRLIPWRRNVVQSLIALSSAISADKLIELVDATIPLLDERRQISDYGDVVELMCHLAERGGTDIKERLSALLYPTGKPVSRTLAQVADVFGRDIFKSDSLREFAKTVAVEIRNQVQLLGPGQVAKPAGEQIFEHSSKKADATLKIYAVQTVGLQLIARRCELLDDTTRSELVDAIPDMATHKDNFCINRESILLAFADMAMSLSATEREKAIATLLPLANGEVEESSEYATAAEVDDLLNPYKFGTGHPEDVQAIALVCVVRLAAFDKLAAGRIENLLVQALSSPNAKVRRAAYSAARRLPHVSEGVVLGILTGLRDPDPNAAVTAFAAMASQPGWTLTPDQWRVFMMAIRYSQGAGSPNLRRHAAAALAEWSSECPPEFSAEVLSLKAAFDKDICWSVRSTASPQ